MLNVNLSPVQIQAQLAKNSLPFQDCLTPYMKRLIPLYYPDYRSRIYSPMVIISCMIASAMTGGASLQKIVTQINAERTAQGEPLASMNTSGISQARSRLPKELLVETALGLSQDSEKAASKNWTWEGFKVQLIDGTTFTANDTPENQAVYPQHKKQQEGLGFPIMRSVVIQSLTTGMITGCQLAPYKGKGTGEMALARQLEDEILKGDLLLGDRYYPSYFLMAFLIKKNGKHGVFQSHASRVIDFRRGKKLGKKDHIVFWEKPPKPSWMDTKEYESFPDSISVREVEIRKETAKRERIVLVTTLLEKEKHSKIKLASLFRKRWKVELALRDIKDTLGLRHLSANTPDMIEKTLWAGILAFNCLRWHLMVAASIGSRDPHSLSVKTCASIITANILNILKSKSKELIRVLANIYWQILQTKIGHRRRPNEPRGAKRKRTSPPLQLSRKTFKSQIIDP